MNSNRNEIIYKWLPQLAKHLNRGEEELKNFGLQASDFPYSGVTFKFEDGSVFNFKYAFAIKGEKVDKDDEYSPTPIVIFSEHTGYYELNMYPDDELIIHE